VYYLRRADTYVVLLAGGDKRTQDSDIETAHSLAREL
jgi:putative addiction module killer protein